MQAYRDSLEDCLDHIDDVFEAMELIKRRIRQRRPLLFERWKTGGFIVDADVVSMYPSLHDIFKQIMDERDGGDPPKEE